MDANENHPNIASPTNALIMAPAAAALPGCRPVLSGLQKELTHEQSAKQGSAKTCRQPCTARHQLKTGGGAI